MWASTAVLLADLGSSIPHITFDMVALSLPVPFDIDNKAYQESMIFLAILPFINLIFVMVVLMIFYCCVDFSSRNDGEKRTCCNVSSWFYMISELVVFLFSLVALYGIIMICFPAINAINESADNIIPAEIQANHIPETVQSIKSQFAAKVDLINSISSKDSVFAAAAEEFRSAGLDDSVLMIENNSFERIIGQARTATTVTLYTSIGLFSLYGLVALLSKAGICFKSKKMLIAITCISFFAMVLCYLSLTIQIPIAVAVSDYCKSPEESQENLIPMPVCDSERELEKIDDVLKQLGIIQKGISNHPDIDSDTILIALKNDLTTVIGFGDSVKLMLNCDVVNEEYEKITASLCTDPMQPFIVGWWMLLLSSMIISVFIVIALLIAPCAWRYYDHEYDHDSPYDKDGEDIPLYRPTTFQQPSYPPTRHDGHLTLPSYLCHSSDDLILDRPPNYAPFS